MTRSAFALFIVAVLIAGCSGSQAADDEVVGVVTEVMGSLTTIESFVVLDAQGRSHKFAVAPGMTVVGSPPSHLRDHLISGEIVRVMFHETPNGGRIADNVVHE